MQYKELYSWVLLVFILVLHFTNPFINYSALAPEPGMCRLFLFVLQGSLQWRGETLRVRRACVAPCPTHRHVRTLTAHSTELQRSPSQGVGLTAFVLCSPESPVMFGALNQTHPLNSYVSVSTRRFSDTQHKGNSA